MTSSFALPVIEPLLNFGRWWLEELRASIPQGLRRHLRSRRPTAIVRPFADRVEILLIDGEQHQLLNDDGPLEALDTQGWVELSTIVTNRRTLLVLDRPLGHVVRLALPRGSWGNARRVIDLQLDRLSPALPDAVLWNWTALREADGIKALVAMVRTADLIQLESLFTSHGVPMPTLAIDSSNGPITLTIGHDGSENAARRHDRRWLAAAAALLLSIPVTSLAGLAIAKNMLRADIAALTDEVGDKVHADAQARRAVAALQSSQPLLAHPTASMVIAKLAQALPQEARLRDLSIDASGLIIASIEGADEQQLSDALTSHFSALTLVATDAEAIGASAAVVGGEPAAGVSLGVQPPLASPSTVVVIMAEIRL